MLTFTMKPTLGPVDVWWLPTATRPPPFFYPFRSSSYLEESWRKRKKLQSHRHSLSQSQANPDLHEIRPEQIFEFGPCRNLEFTQLRYLIMCPRELKPLPGNVRIPRARHRHCCC